MRITVISTVLNEAKAIHRLLDSLMAQSRRPDEVIIVDGGSHDGTVAEMSEYAGRLPLRILVKAGANISQGRNLAIEAANTDLIASVDAGVWLEPGWLEKLEAGFGADSATGQPGGQIQAVAGFFVADPQTTFEIALGATSLPDVDEIDPSTFLPSSRSVAFTVDAWRAAGRYPEWIDYCEDLIFDLRLRDAAGPFCWAPGALAHFRPRTSLRGFVRQYYRYARGDGKADLWRSRHAVRYVTYLVVVPALLGLGALHSPFWLLCLLAGAALYTRGPFRRLARHLPSLQPRQRVQAVLWVPAIRVAGDLAKMAGYPAGWVWRLRHWGDAQIHWRTEKSG